jgi:hypothetical protein
MTDALAYLSAMSMAQMLEPVPISRIFSGVLPMGARWEASIQDEVEFAVL